MFCTLVKLIHDLCVRQTEHCEKDTYISVGNTNVCIYETVPSSLLCIRTLNIHIKVFNMNMTKCGRLSPNITTLNSYIRKISLADLVFLYFSR